MKVLIIVTNRNNHPTSVIPYGACIVAEATAREGHVVNLLDLMFRYDPITAIETALPRYSPDVIGISARNLDNNDMQAPVSFVPELRGIVQAIRRKSSAPVVLGGSAVGVMPEQLLRYTYASFAIMGDGEVGFPALLSAMGNGSRLQEVPRLAWLENGRYQTGFKNRCKLSPTTITPAFEKWVNLQAYLAASATVPIQSKRGARFIAFIAPMV